MKDTHNNVLGLDVVKFVTVSCKVCCLQVRIPHEPETDIERQAAHRPAWCHNHAYRRVDWEETGCWISGAKSFFPCIHPELLKLLRRMLIFRDVHSVVVFAASVGVAEHGGPGDSAHDRSARLGSSKWRFNHQNWYRRQPLAYSHSSILPPCQERDKFYSQD